MDRAKQKFPRNFREISENPNRMESIQEIVKNLPDQNKALLSYLLSAMAAANVNSNVNHMTASNLSLVFAPALIRPPKEKFLLGEEHAPAINFMVKLIIENHERLLPLLDTPRK